MLDQLNELEARALLELDSLPDAHALEQWRIAILGTRGELRKLGSLLKTIDEDQRPTAGRRLNEVKQSIESAFTQRQNHFSSDDLEHRIDVTEPGTAVGLGRRHVIGRTIDDIIDIFGLMGFRVVRGPEVEDEWHNFNALNIPADHPARDPMDNYYLDGGGLLRSQTSTVQIRVMEETEPPLKIVAPGRVYRPDTHDATHFSMFHQVEGLCVGEGVDMVDLKTTLYQFARACFGPDVELRIRPSFFPFTEPSAEVDVWMKIKGTPQWVELGGCGMVDPAVFDAVGYDPERWTGFAFGLGVERIAMRRYGIADIRWFFENDVRFLRQV